MYSLSIIECVYVSHIHILKLNVLGLCHLELIQEQTVTNHAVSYIHGLHTAI